MVVAVMMVRSELPAQLDLRDQPELSDLQGQLERMAPLAQQEQGAQRAQRDQRERKAHQDRRAWRERQEQRDLRQWFLGQPSRRDLPSKGLLLTRSWFCRCMEPIMATRVLPALLPSRAQGRWL